MSDAVSYVLQAKVAEGQQDALRELIGEMTDATREAEPGTLVYEWFLSDDGSTCHIYERYADSDALMAHLGNFGAFAKRFFTCLQPQGLTVYGDASEAVKKAFADMGARYMATAGGFAR